MTINICFLGLHFEGLSSHPGQSADLYSSTTTLRLWSCSWVVAVWVIPSHVALHHSTLSLYSWSISLLSLLYLRHCSSILHCIKLYNLEWLPILSYLLYYNYQILKLSVHLSFFAVSLCLGTTWGGICRRVSSSLYPSTSSLFVWTLPLCYHHSHIYFFTLSSYLPSGLLLLEPTISLTFFFLKLHSSP